MQEVKVFWLRELLRFRNARGEIIPRQDRVYGGESVAADFFAFKRA